MSDSGVQTATGDGEWLFPAASPVAAMVYWIDTPTVEVDYLSTYTPRRTMHAGWIAIGSGQTGVPAGSLTAPDPAICWWSYFDHERNQRKILDDFPFFDRIAFSIPSGITAKFVVYYSL